MRSFAAVISMGLFGSLFGCSKGDDGPPKRYLSDQAFRQNLAKQMKMSPLTVGQLRKHGVTDNSMLKLEFFFYTDNDEKALALADALRVLDYKAESGSAARDSRLLIVTGWTTPIKMTDSEVVAWTQKMCQLGYEHDCEFDGWGTNPQQ
jgi:hypothetical protein